MNKQYCRLSMVEREKISQRIWNKEKMVIIAERIRRHPSTVSREIHKQVKKRKWCYSAILGEKLARENCSRRGRKKKIDSCEELKYYVYEKLKIEWSPEEIAERLKLEYAGNMKMRISHETIYQHLYCLPKGELKKELMKGLRHERKRRLSRQNIHDRRQQIADIISISERPKEVEDRIVPGHWEGDLIVGKDHKSAIGTLVERTMRITLLVPLTAKDAFTVRCSFAAAFERIPKKFAKTLTYDRGKEMTQHKPFTAETKIKVYFADPYSPWQRGTNENTNGLIRQYFPKGTDFREVSPATIAKVEQRLNSRPRKVLGYYTPAEKYYELITGQKIALET